MTASDFIKIFNSTDCPVAAIDGNLDIVAVNDGAEDYIPFFSKNELNNLLMPEEIVEINYHLSKGKKIGLSPKNGAFKGGMLEFIPAQASEGDFVALVFVTNKRRNLVRNSPEGEQYFMARFFEPKVREAMVSIFSNIDMVRHSQTTMLSDKSEENLENISDEAYGILRLADHVRLISALEAGETDVTNSDIAEFTKSLIASAKMMLMRYKIVDEYKVDTESRTHSCSFDREALTRAILCLISNACKASDRGGLIKICVTLTDIDYRFTISNGGAHIPSHLIPHVTEPYFSYRNSEEDERGTGLGLSIAKAVAESHGGSLLLQSSKDFGTTVMLRIPVEFQENNPNFVGQSPNEYITDRYSPVYVELYDFF